MLILSNIGATIIASLNIFGGLKGGLKQACRLLLGCALLTLGSVNSGAVEPALTVVSVNINTASPAMIAAVLYGIGLKKAHTIVEHRNLYGPFRTLSELKDVKGIGSTHISNNRGRIRLD